MLNTSVYRWIASGYTLGAVLMLFGCSSSKPYTLVAQLPALSQQSRIVAATIDVEDYVCNVRIVTLDSTKAWTPLCFVKKNQPQFKSLTIAGREVDFGPAPSGGFNVLSMPLPSLPASTSNAAAVTMVTNTSNPMPAAGATTTAIPTFPTQWNLMPYPGHAKLQGQNTGFLVTSAVLTITGSQGMLDITYKTSYAPLHLACTVTTNQKGDFTLIFNPTESVRISQGGDYTILLTSEGQSISGNIWDSHGFASWTPSLPPQWSAVSYSSD
ncbi:MAG: hypothetical protein WBR15_07570 [Gammaproteobacteria bacterium]